MPRESRIAYVIALNALLIASVLVALSTSARAADPAADRMAEMQRQLDVLGQEIQKLKLGEASGGPTSTPPGSSGLSFGPGVSKVYRTQSGLSIGGYGELLFENFGAGFNDPTRRTAPGEDFDAATEAQRRFDVLRAVLYVGYKFSDSWVLNSEIEFEHGGSELAVEFLYMDYFHKPWLNFRGGSVLMPMGLTNEIHEPTTYPGSLRPRVETLIIPSTWSQYGVGVFGEAGPVTYRSYIVNGLNASAFDAANGIREGRSGEGVQAGTQPAWVIRADYTGTPGLVAGGSFYLGRASTTPASGFDLISVPGSIGELHVQYNWRALDLRAMGAYSVFNNVDALNARKGLATTDSVGSRQAGAYFQAGYDVLSGSEHALIPFVRYEWLDTQLEVPPGYTKTGSNLMRSIVSGLNYKPLPQLVFKGDYQWYFLGDGRGVNQWNLAMGYVF